MALSDVFLAPIGLVALLAAVPLLLVYLLKPEPTTLRLPTFAFLSGEAESGGRNPVIDRLRRNLLLLVQLLALVVIATAIAAPYVPIAEERVVEETVLVVDTSASMATRIDGATRFARATALATDEVAGTTTVVVTDPPARVALRERGPTEAGDALSALRVTDAPGNLREAIGAATAVAGEGARIVVVSDFADATDWRTAVRAARASDRRVDLVPVGGGGVDNVGIVDRTFDGESVVVTVKNYGDARADRTLSFAGRSAPLSLAPGDVATATFDVPAGGGTLRLAPADAFPTDDTVAVAAPAEPTVRVLLVTNDENRFLRTALDVIDEVDLTVATPPASITGRYDVVVFSNVAPDRLLGSTVELARETVAAGGGVAIQAHPGLGATPYGNLLLIEPTGQASAPSLRVTDDRLTAGISFPPPEEYVQGDLREGRTLVSTADGTPIVATASRGPGRLLYYGYLEDASAFKFNYLYPVFWKRSVFYLAGRPTLAELNRRTGDRLSFAAETAVVGPVDRRTTTSLVLSHAGTYTAGDRRYGVGLLDERESDVAAPPIEEAGAGPPIAAETEERTVPLELTPLVALLGLSVVLAELAFLRYRGDL